MSTTSSTGAESRLNFTAAPVTVYIGDEAKVEAYRDGDDSDVVVRIVDAEYRTVASIRLTSDAGEAAFMAALQSVTVFTVRNGHSVREEWGYRDDRDGGTIGPVPEQQARDAVAAVPDLTLLYRVVEISEWVSA